MVGEGFHAYAGGPHAEIVALAQAGERARGGTAVVTLEPCNHTGRTGPVRAGADRGRGRAAWSSRWTTRTRSRPAARPRCARRASRSRRGYAAAEAEAGNIAWLTAVRRGRPYVTWKFAATLDGRSAAADGTSQWITSAPARTDVHELRSTVDAIIVGRGHGLADDPQLTVRELRDGRAGDPAAAAGGGGLAPGVPRQTPGCATAPRPPGSRPRPRSAPARTAGSTCPRCWPRCTTAACAPVLLEGGPTLAGAFLAAGLVDRVVGYVAPKLLGAGPAALVGAGIGTIAEAIELDLTDVTQIGPDLRFTALLRQKEES